MSSWVTTVLISFGKALLISLSILIGSCCIRFLYRLWIKKMGCYDGSDDVSESCKYEMELQSVQDFNHVTSVQPPAPDSVSEIELPPSPGANTSCPPYSTYSRYPDKRACDDFSDNFSGMWRQADSNNSTDPISEGGEMTDTELTSMAGETTTVCSVLTGNEEMIHTDSPPLPDMQSPSLLKRIQTSPPPRPQRSPLVPRLRSPPLPEMQSPPLPDLPQSPPLPEFQEYQCYVEMPRQPSPARHDRGTELFLSQYYKNLEQEHDSSRSPPPL